MRQFLLQMAGWSGAGKSTLARAIGEATGAVVLDKDVIKSSLLSEGLGEEANGLSYAVFFAIAGDLLSQRRSVVLDSPANYPMIRERGAEIVRNTCAAYRIIKCHCSDETEHARRLDTRPRLASQLATLEDVRTAWQSPAVVSLTEPHLDLDTARPFDACLAEALAYLEEGEV